LLRLHWVSVADTHALPLPSITRMVLAEVQRRLEQGHKPEDKGPFIRFRNGRTVIDEI